MVRFRMRASIRAPPARLFTETPPLLIETPRRSGAALHESDVGDPVALPAREAVVLPLAVKIVRPAAKQRRIDALEGVHADHRIEVSVDAAGDDRYDAAARAHVKLGGARAVRVLRHERGIPDRRLERAARVRSPHAAVLGAERAAARACLDLGGTRLPGERKRDVAAVAGAADQHGATNRPRPCGSSRPRSRARRKTWRRCPKKSRTRRSPLRRTAEPSPRSRQAS